MRDRLAGTSIGSEFIRQWLDSIDDRDPIAVNCLGVNRAMRSWPGVPYPFVSEAIL
jgi:hypothetical protein